MLNLRIQSDYNGPTISEMLPLLADTEAPVEIAWGNTRPEIAALNRVRHKKITLVVPDLATMERAAAILGLSMVFEPSLKASAFKALNVNDTSNWRNFVTQMGAGVSRGLLIGIAGDYVRRGRRVPSLRAVVNGCMFDGVSSFDADVLLGLQARG